VEPLTADRYKIVRVPFKDGRPEGWYENFARGFWASGEQRVEVWGRPAALAVAKDGSLLVADDTVGTIWRISYNGPPPTEHAVAPAESVGSAAKPRPRTAEERPPKYA
jgi:hypothetical protein